MRIAAHSRSVADGHLSHARAIKTGQRGNEAVQFAVQVNVLQNFGAIRLEGCTEIAQIQAGDFRHQPVRDARRNLARDRVVDAVLAPAAGDIVAFFDLGKQRRDIVGIMLQVAIERHNDVALALRRSPPPMPRFARNYGAIG